MRKSHESVQRTCETGAEVLRTIWTLTPCPDIARGSKAAQAYATGNQERAASWALDEQLRGARLNNATMC